MNCSPDSAMTARALVMCMLLRAAAPLPLRAQDTRTTQDEPPPLLTLDNAVFRALQDNRLVKNADATSPSSAPLSSCPELLGLPGFYDVGRVFLSGEHANTWHHGAGGGPFFATPGRQTLFSLSAARSEGRTACYLRLGLAP
jgi:hypothetical protein